MRGVFIAMTRCFPFVCYKMIKFSANKRDVKKALKKHINHKSFLSYQRFSAGERMSWMEWNDFAQFERNYTKQILWQPNNNRNEWKLHIPTQYTVHAIMPARAREQISYFRFKRRSKHATSIILVVCARFWWVRFMNKNVFSGIWPPSSIFVQLYSGTHKRAVPHTVSTRAIWVKFSTLYVLDGIQSFWW